MLSELRQGFSAQYDTKQKWAWAPLQTTLLKVCEKSLASCAKKIVYNYSFRLSSGLWESQICNCFHSAFLFTISLLGSLLVVITTLITASHMMRLVGLFWQIPCQKIAIIHLIFDCCRTLVHINVAPVPGWCFRYSMPELILRMSVFTETTVAYYITCSLY